MDERAENISIPFLPPPVKLSRTPSYVAEQRLGVQIGDPWADTPLPGTVWKLLDDTARRRRVEKALAKWGYAFQCLEATVGGDVILAIDPLSASVRGELLRDCEMALKLEVDGALTVWLRPLQDRNAMRKFRGVKIREG